MTPARGMIHLTDTALLEHVYGLSAADEHLEDCAVCRERLAGLQSRRAAMDTAAEVNEVGASLLAAQRRAIYGRLSATVPWWQGGEVLRYVSAGAGVLALGTGLVLMQDSKSLAPKKDVVSDADLACQVSQLSQEAEASPALPLKGLFE